MFFTSGIFLDDSDRFIRLDVQLVEAWINT